MGGGIGGRGKGIKKTPFFFLAPPHPRAKSERSPKQQSRAKPGSHWFFSAATPIWCRRLRKPQGLGQRQHFQLSQAHLRKIRRSPRCADGWMIRGAGFAYG